MINGIGLSSPAPSFTQTEVLSPSYTLKPPERLFKHSDIQALYPEILFNCSEVEPRYFLEVPWEIFFFLITFSYFF